MAAKKKTFDAIAASRLWRLRTARRLRDLTFAQQQELLHSATATLYGEKLAPENRRAGNSAVVTPARYKPILSVQGPAQRPYQKKHPTSHSNHRALSAYSPAD